MSGLVKKIIKGIGQRPKRLAKSVTIKAQMIWSGLAKIVTPLFSLTQSIKALILNYYFSLKVMSLLRIFQLRLITTHEANVSRNEFNSLKKVIF